MSCGPWTTARPMLPKEFGHWRTKDFGFLVHNSCAGLYNLHWSESQSLLERGGQQSDRSFAVPTPRKCRNWYSTFTYRYIHVSHSWKPHNEGCLLRFSRRPMGRLRRWAIHSSQRDFEAGSSERYVHGQALNTHSDALKCNCLVARFTDCLQQTVDRTCMSAHHHHHQFIKSTNRSKLGEDTTSWKTTTR